MEIEERMVYSDYSKLREELGDGKFEAIQEKIDESLRRINLEDLVQPLDINRFTR